MKENLLSENHWLDFQNKAKFEFMSIAEENALKLVHLDTETVNTFRQNGYIEKDDVAVFVENEDGQSLSTAQLEEVDEIVARLCNSHCKVIRKSVRKSENKFSIVIFRPLLH